MQEPRAAARKNHSVSAPEVEDTAPHGYEQAFRDLRYVMGHNEEEVRAALEQMEPPYGLQEAVMLIHRAKNSSNPFGIRHPEDDSIFIPKVGTRIRRCINGSNWHATITKNADITSAHGYQTITWETTDEEDPMKKDDLTYYELLTSRESRPIQPHYPHRRQLCSLELFSGSGILTQEFFERKFRVRSIDIDQASFATDKVDILRARFDNIGFVPDFIWASPVCTTFSNMSSE